MVIPMTKASPTPQLDSLIRDDPDLVDRIFDYLLREFPDIEGPKLAETKLAVRENFGGSEQYVRSAAAVKRQEVAVQVLSRFNGRNATEVARELKISRTSVYRFLKQAGKKPASK